MSKIAHAIIPGGLTEADHEQIFELAERGWKCTRIAQKICKHPSTVQWFMYRNALAAPKYGNQREYVRNGRLVKPFSPEEDQFIEARRIEGGTSREIAAAVSAKFGHPRSFHTIETRLVMLSAREAA